MPNITEKKETFESCIKMDLALHGRCICIFDDMVKISKKLEDFTQAEQEKLIDAYYIIYKKCLKDRDPKAKETKAKVVKRINEKQKERIKPLKRIQEPKQDPKS